MQWTSVRAWLPGVFVTDAPAAYIDAMLAAIVGFGIDLLVALIFGKKDQKVIDSNVRLMEAMGFPAQLYDRLIVPIYFIFSSQNTRRSL